MKKNKSYKGVYISLIVLSVVAIFVISAFALSGAFYPSDTFYKNVKINGIDVSGMSIIDAKNVVQANFNDTASEISVTLKFKENEWIFSAKDFEVIDDFSTIVQSAYAQTTSNNIIDRHLIQKQLKANDGNLNVSYRNMLGGFNEKLDYVISQINQELKEPQVSFDPNSEEIFTYIDGQSQIIVDKVELENLIDNAFESSKKIIVYIPYEEIKPTTTIEELQQKTQLLSTFSTSYASSTANRKSNVRTALGAFNGQIFEPLQEVSFNTITGARSKENGYKPANIILNGVYVEGSGGGVCQASTTLYNALLLAGIDILEVNKHSLPTHYVPLALDAMVSEGVSDLRFINNTQSNIYIKTWGDKDNVYVNIYGEKNNSGEYYQTRSEFIKSIPHPGDRIVPDSTGEYADKVTFKGEYLRIKYPQEGYEAKAYLQRYSADGTLLDEKLIRHEIYNAQEGIIIEGIEELYDGITLPENNVKYIPPQTTTTSKENISNKLNNGTEKYNP